MRKLDEGTSWSGRSCSTRDTRVGRRKSFIFILIGVLLLSIPLRAQAKTVTLNVQNASLEQVIWEIRKQTGYVFVYAANDVKAVTGLTVDVKNKSYLDVLDDCLTNTKLTYSAQGDNIVIRSKTAQDPPPQPVTIKGVVVDATGAPIIGASVVVKGTTTGVTTNIQGEFELRTNNVPGLALQFSYMGKVTTEIAYNNQENMVVTMQDNSEQIQEVVVTGYQTIDRRLFTGSADILKAEDMAAAGAADISRSLQGRSAGVQVQNVSGTFGAAPKMRVRGASSIYGDQKPLWVVDGIVLEDVVDVGADDLSSGDAATLISSAVAGLNSDDIESFQILKDASATALYGARAMNGVVVITTKRGKKGSTRISYSGEFSIRMKPSYNNYNIMNSQQQMMLYLDLEEKGWLSYSDVLNSPNGGVYHKMYTALDNYYPDRDEFELKNTRQERQKYLQNYEKINTDWFDALFKNSIQQSHSVSLSGGSEKSNFFVSLSYLNDPGWSISDNVSRYTANMNASFEINKYLKFNFLTSNSFRQQKAPGTVGRNTDAATGEVSRQFDLNPFSYALNTSRTMRPYDKNGDLEYYTMNYAPFNIINELRHNYIDIDMLDSKFQGELEIRPLQGLDVKIMGAIRFVKSSREHKITENSNMAEAYRADYNAEIRKKNDFLYNDPDQPGIPAYSVLPQGGFYNRTDNRLLNYYVRAMSNFTRSIASRHMFNVSAGMEARSTDRKETHSSGYGIQYDRGNVPFVDYHILKQILERGGQYYGIDNGYDRFVAFFLTGGFSWDSKYTLNLTGRYDGSNRMGESNSSRWLPTWNVSGAWHIYQEPFIKEIEAITQMTLRSTYGLTASMGPATNAKAVFSNDIVYRPSQGEKENQITIIALENAGLTWEKQYEFNVGLDLGLFDRISISTDFYTRNMFDLIGILTTSGIGGESRKAANYAKMKSHGVEFTLGTRNIVSPKFNWTSNFTFSYNTNKITELNTASSVMQYLAFSGAPKVGNPVRGIYTIPFMGLNGAGLPTFLNHLGETTVTGVSFQETLNTDFMKYMGSADPKFTGGFDNTFKYGPFRLNVFFAYQFGSKVWLDQSFSYRYYDNTASPKEMADRWMVPGDEYKTNIPVIASKRQHEDEPALRTAYNAYNFSSLRVAKGDFIRLKEVALNYDFQENLLKMIGLSSVSVRLSASNLALLYSDKKLNGQDPEFFRSGGVAMPVPRQFTLSVKIGF